MQFAILDFGSAEALAGKLTLSAEEAVHTLEPMLEIEADMFRIERSVFSSGGRRGGGSWKKLSDSTVKRKGGDSRILQDTDALYDSVTRKGAEFQILETTNTGILFGTDRPWAYVQQSGSVAAGVPARPFLRFLPTDIDRWTELLLYHVAKPFING